MIVRPLVGTFPDLDMSIHGAPVDYTSINAVEIVMSENMHDSLSFEMAGIPTRAVTEYVDAPVKVVATMSGRSQVFTGRVVDVMPIANTSSGLVNGSPFQTSRIMCMGSSYDMRDEPARTWSDYTLRDIIDRYVERYRISVDIPRGASVRRPLAVQGSRSDWKFLVDEVERNALSVTLHGTHLHIFDPYSAVSRNGPVVSLVTLNKTGMDPATYPGQILDFKGRFGARNSDGNYKENLISVLSGKNSYTISTGDGTSRFKEYVGDYGTSYAEAMLMAQAARKTQYDYEAEVEIVGVIGVVPGSVVNVDSYNNREFDGYWYVREVKHRVATGGFVSNLSIARNKETNLVPDGTAVFTTPPEPELVGSKWEASRRVIRAY